MPESKIAPQRNAQRELVLKRIIEHESAVDALFRKHSDLHGRFGGDARIEIITGVESKKPAFAVVAGEGNEPEVLAGLRMTKKGKAVISDKTTGKKLFEINLPAEAVRAVNYAIWSTTRFIEFLRMNTTAETAGRGAELLAEQAGRFFQREK